MGTTKSKISLLRTLSILTCLFIATQILLTWINFETTETLDTFVSASITHQILHLKIFVVGCIQLLFSQFLIYGLFVGFIWYVATAIGSLGRLNELSTYYLGLFIWVVSIAAILVANAYFAPYSFFATFVRLVLSERWILLILQVSCTLLLSVILLTFYNLLLSLWQRKNLAQHSGVLCLIIAALALVTYDKLSARPEAYSAATADKPNIIIIGLDAARHDCIGFHNKQNVPTPHINSFLASSIEFTQSYTTLARTFPSWTSILASTYPLHNQARGNNTDLDFIHIDETLPKQLKLAGYETIYGTDDTRFNNTNERFGFDHLISPPMGINDFLLGTLNDFPLSNLLIPTPLGKLLFPYNFANHGTATTYTPGNFLELVKDRLHEREAKPLFLAVHFTITHWPFYWFNDKQEYGIHEMERYRLSMQGADKQFNQFMKILAQNNLLDHSIVIFLSDHGIAMGLPGDRLVQPARYQGKPENIKKIAYAKYSSSASLGIDTGYGYGGDLLTLEAYHTLLAFHGYGVNIGPSHAVNERVSVMDIAPTILGLLHLPAFKRSDGISLLPAFANRPLASRTPRPFFLETTFSPEEIQKENISVNKVLQKTVQLYRVAPSGLVFIKNNAEILMNKDKQMGILQGNWLLVRYPLSHRTRLATSKSSQQNFVFETYVLPPYLVLVNLTTGKWTTEMQNPFAKASPAKNMLKELAGFYGNELGQTA
jgi:arylsulfatase A-like enzyme